ncbi:large proline-rich protein BAG6-like isoform X1 [Acipenser ruthenus]|uniref:large proline-rich protein BAG6-like isoform X1 n=1 Tax=Acipenser ruthenus TaxID=7906 RepID=UPI00274278D9|nr:large proline-rich protein BAG6-like isoform X1 [Acipenser ruthenus]
MVESENFDVTVKTLDSQSRSYSVGAEITVKEFKEHISSSVGIPVEKQRLIYQGRVLQDEKKLKEYNVDGKVIHLVERAPPQTSPGTETSGPSGPGLSTPHGSTAPHHDRNANSYVMLGTLNLPVNLMDPQQIQHSVQQVMAGFGEAGSNARVSTSTGSNGSSVDVHIDMEQAIQSEPRMRLILAQNLLRDTTAVLNRLEGRQNSTHNSGSQASENPSTQTQPPPPPPPPPYPSTGPGSEGAAEPMDTSTTAAPSAATSSSSSSSSSSFSFSFSSSSSSSSSTQTEGGAAAAGTSTGPNHPAPAEFLEVLSELRRVEDRLQPFIQRSQEILSTATSSDYNNNAQEREADQCILNLVGEALRLIGNAFVALSDLRCNLSAATPRHLHVVRPMSHYTSPVMLQQAGIPIQINLGTPVTMAANGRQAAEGQAAAGTTPEQQRTTEAQATPTHSQVPPSQPQATPTQPQAHHNHPRVIRITHHTMEPVVMMQMNIDDSGTGPAPSAAPGQGTGGLPQMQIPGLPAEFMQAIVHQITQQAVSMATAASSGQQVPGFQPPPARVVITRPTFTPRPPNMTPRPANINLRAPQPGQPGAQQQAGPVPNASLSQMISGLVGQLLQPVMMGQAGAAAPPSSGQGAPPSSSSSSSSAPPSSSASTSGQTSTSTTSTASTGYPTPTAPPEAQHISQLLGSILGAGGAMGMPPSITVSMPGVPAFIQGMTDFMQAAQQVPGPPQSSDPQQTPPAPSAAPQQTAAPPPQQQAGAGAGGAAPESLSPEFFTSVVQGVLSSVMGSLGAQQDSTESIADFIQRLSSTNNIFEPGAGAAAGFFGDLLSLICQNFSMVDMVMLLHGQFQPLQRIQPQLSSFFREQYLQGQEPTDANIRTASDTLINELEEHIIESFSSVSVREGVDITRTNLDFLREQFNCIATHILQCADHTFGLRLLELCNQGLFECLALNLYCLRGEQSALTAVINDRIRRMSADVNPSLVNWLTTIMGIRLQMILEHMPVTEEQILHYVRNTRSEAVPETAPEPLSEEMPEVMERETSASPVPATTAEEAMPSPEQPVSMGAQRAEPESEPWAATVPPVRQEWVPIIRQDLQTQRKMKSQPPLSDAYLCGMPAKRRKTAQSDGPYTSLSEAVNRAARTVGAKPITSSESLQGDLDTPELQEAYTNLVKSDIQKRLQEDPEYSTQRFPNTHQVFDEES